MKLDYTIITDRLSRALLANELGGDPAVAYRFSRAKGGTSGISFGRCQWDLSNNLAAAAILKECGFSQTEISILESEKLPADGDKLNAKLLAAKTIIDRRDLHEIGQAVAWVRDCCQAGGIDIYDNEAFVHLADYHNQFNLEQHGKCIRALQSLKCPVTALGIRKYKKTTKWGMGEPDDVDRRWDNIHSLFST